ncbi:MAG: PilN domain-containing protein [Desulfatibacillum sp.]|nr:PilN domain-containing protein [Desulfatibacillum sp.]
MIRVNLLPFRAARKSDNVKRQVVVFIALIVLFVLACVAYTGILLNQVSTLEEELAQAETDLVKFQKQAAEVDAILAEIAILEKREATIDGLRRARFVAVKLMDYLTELVLPPAESLLSKQEQRLWITELSTKDGDLEQKIMIQGVAVDNKDVAAFLNRLENHTEILPGPSLSIEGGKENIVQPYFREVRLLRLAAAADAELLNFKEFNIECVRPAPVPKESEEDEKKKKKKK